MLYFLTPLYLAFFFSAHALLCVHSFIVFFFFLTALFFFSYFHRYAHNTEHTNNVLSRSKLCKTEVKLFLCSLK